jgi:hypothetical protein
LIEYTRNAEIREEQNGRDLVDFELWFNDVGEHFITLKKEFPLSRFGFLAQHVPASAIKASSLLLQLLLMGRILLPPARVGD